MSQLQAQWAADTANTTAVSAGTPHRHLRRRGDLRGHDQSGADGPVQWPDGTATTTTYTALDANGNSIAQGGTPTFAAAASYAVTTTVTTPDSQNLLVQNGTDLTNFSITGAAAAQTALTPSTRLCRRSPTTPR